MATIKKSKLMETLKEKGVSEGFIGKLLARISGNPKNDPDYKKLVKRGAELDKEYDAFIKKHNLKKVEW